MKMRRNTIQSPKSSEFAPYEINNQILNKNRYKVVTENTCKEKGTMPSEVLSKESIFNLNPKPMPIVDRIII